MNASVRWLLAFALSSLGAVPVQAEKPNIVLILSDDLGYGDVGCYGATRTKTPNIDRLAAHGLRFTDAHSTAATCTPSRYSILTGQYAFRKKGTGILPGDAPLILEPGRPTLPSLLKDAGYTTGCVGKWHLGLGTGNLDWNGDIMPGPLEVGFDYSFIIPATGDRVPCVFVENHRVVGGDPSDPIFVSYVKPVGDEPTGASHPELLRLKPSHGHDQTIVDGISRIGYMSGGKHARWHDEDIADVLGHHAASFIEQNKHRPFFLYFATHDIHVPRVPHPRFSGTSQCGVRGDVIQQLDGSVGGILSVLERLGLSENTLVLFSSDNGPVVDDGYQDGAASALGGHAPAGPFRGGKYSIYEGGTRVPLIARWPARLRPGTSDALVSQVDLMASLAALVEKDLPDNAGPDSWNTLSTFWGGPAAKGRDHLVEEAQGLALRKGTWKFIPVASDSAPTKLEPGDRAPKPSTSFRAQLYDLAGDPGERNNVAELHRDLVEQFSAELARIRNLERSRP